MSRFKLVALCLWMGHAMGCAVEGDEPPLSGGPPPSYGTPTAATTIHLVEEEGLAGSNYDREVRIAGTAATYRFGTTSEDVTISIRAVQEIVHELEAIAFLDLNGDYTMCSMPASDASVVTLEVALPAGPKTVKHYTGCDGGVFDELSRLERQIYALSGYTAWPGHL